MYIGHNSGTCKASLRVCVWWSVVGEDRGRGVWRELPSCVGASELHREKTSSGATQNFSISQFMRNKPHPLIPSRQSIESKLVFHTNTCCARDY